MESRPHKRPVQTHSEFGEAAEERRICERHRAVLGESELCFSQSKGRGGQNADIVPGPKRGFIQILADLHLSPSGRGEEEKNERKDEQNDGEKDKEFVFHELQF